MARTPTETENELHDITPAQEKNVGEMIGALQTLNTHTHQINENAQQLALQLNYDGTLTVGALEDEIRFYQRRTIEAVLELGKRLLILKELTPFGEFEKRVELLGINIRMAQKFMSATLKFSKANSSSLLKAAGNQTKLLELVVFDDDEIEALKNGESARGITLDQIDTMSVSELKKALREAREQAKQVAETKDLIIQKKDQKINQLDEQLAMHELKRTQPALAAAASPDQTALDARNAVLRSAERVKAAVMTDLRAAIKHLVEDTPGQHSLYASACLIEIGRELAILRGDFNLPDTVSESLMPEWLTQEDLDAIQGREG